jgi:hypothetical protein
VCARDRGLHKNVKGIRAARIFLLQKTKNDFGEDQIEPFLKYVPIPLK